MPSRIDSNVNHINAATKAYNRAAKHMSELSRIDTALPPQDTIEFGIAAANSSRKNASEMAAHVSEKGADYAAQSFNRVLGPGDSMRVIRPGSPTKTNGASRSNSAFNSGNFRLNTSNVSASAAHVSGASFGNILQKTLAGIKGADKVLQAAQNDENIIKIASGINEAEMHIKVATTVSKKFTDSLRDILSIPL